MRKIKPRDRVRLTTKALGLGLGRDGDTGRVITLRQNHSIRVIRDGHESAEDYPWGHWQLDPDFVEE